MAFIKKNRDLRRRIVEAYLVETGEEAYVPSEFHDWLYDHKDHPVCGQAWQWIWGKSDAELARERRIELCREMVSDLRIVVRETKFNLQETGVVVTKEYPAFFSPMATRGSGGGYTATDPTNPAHIEELKRQGIQSLKAWLSRYGDAFDADSQTVADLIAAYDAAQAEPEPA